jgi:D-aminopeptidase
MTLPPRFERVVSAIGDLARPLSLMAIAAATAEAIATGDHVTAGAGGATLVALYTARSLENYGQQREAAKVARAQ